MSEAIAEVEVEDVTLPNGYKVKDVPMDVSDAELKKELPKNAPP